MLAARNLPSLRGAAGRVATKQLIETRATKQSLCCAKRHLHLAQVQVLFRHGTPRNDIEQGE